MGKYFGTDGFRGEANVDLTVEHAYKVGRFLGWYYRQDAPDARCRIVIGKDTRRSSYMFEYSLVAGLTACRLFFLFAKQRKKKRRAFARRGAVLNLLSSGW